VERRILKDLDTRDCSVPVRISDLYDPLDLDRTHRIKRRRAYRLRLGF
jgi:hypothetical protein